jgi:hypothetical protein
VITHSKAAFALFWLAPSPELLRANQRIFVRQLCSELYSALAGRVNPHVVHVSAGCSSAVVELIPVGGGDYGGGGDVGGFDDNGGVDAVGLAAWCQDELQRQLLAGALRGGIIARCFVAIQCATAPVAATPPLPAGEWSETSMLVRPCHPKKIDSGCKTRYSLTKLPPCPAAIPVPSKISQLSKSASLIICPTIIPTRSA